MFKDKTIHFIGIGGISMSGIAKITESLGAKITGSDITPSSITENLIKEGIDVKYDHHPEMINNADIVIYTAAIKDDDPELVRSRKLNKTCYERAEFLGIISQSYENCLCISGTHGKSTTTGMVASVFLEANLDPTIQIGAILPSINSNTRIGDKKYFIMEACEYVDSFLHFHPTAIIITNIDNDHLDYFKNLDNIKKSFNKYVNLLNDSGILVKNNDDINSQNVECNYQGKIITYGIKNEALYQAKDIKCDQFGHYQFNLYYQNKLITDINLNVFGYHNIYNAMAAFALCANYVTDINIIKKGLEKYRGVGRRFEYLGKYNNALIYDDYAHHPTEIKTVIDSVKQIKHQRNYVIFQSHTYSRTKEHLNEFAQVLAEFDNIIIAPIYPARETNIYNIKEEMLVDKIKKKNPHVIYLDTFAKITDYIKENVHDGDIVITVGAGPVNKIAKDLTENS